MPDGIAYEGSPGEAGTRHCSTVLRSVGASRGDSSFLGMTGSVTHHDPSVLQSAAWDRDDNWVFQMTGQPMRDNKKRTGNKAGPFHKFK
jgi:hypothetical protein